MQSSKILYPQPGGFYYMDGVHRDLLRGCKSVLGKYERETHVRMASFFEKSYNQSGDVTALNHYFWHSMQLYCILGKSNESNSAKIEILESTLNRILENALPARGCLYAYDHCFLLLRLYDLLNASREVFEYDVDKIANASDATIRINKQYSAFSRRVILALCEVYEDNVDSKYGASASSALMENAQILKQLRDRERNIHAQKMWDEEQQKIQNRIAKIGDVYNVSIDDKWGASSSKSLREGTQITQQLEKIRDEIGEERLAEAIGNSRKIDNIDLARAYYRIQKAAWQNLEVPKSYFFALHALKMMLKEGPVTNSVMNANASSLDDLDKTVKEIYAVFGIDSPPKNEKELVDTLGDMVEKIRKKYQRISPTPHRVLVHRIILRLIRTSIRISTYGECAKERDEPQGTKFLLSALCEIFLEFGKDINLGDDPNSSTVKLLAARYHSSRGLKSLYDLNRSKGPGIGLKMTYYNHQAQSRAMRADGASSAVYEANTLIDEAEMLLWNARITLWKEITETKDNTEDNTKDNTKERKKNAYADATSRQESALRHFELARTLLVSGSVALPSWRELTVLRIATTADILKRLTGQYIDIPSLDETDKIRELILSKIATLKTATDNEIESHHGEIAKLKAQVDKIEAERAFVFADFAYHAEQAGFELGYLLPLLWNDTWRGTRAGVQLVRIAGYIARMMWEITKVLDKQYPDKQHDVASQAASIAPYSIPHDNVPPVVVSLNKLIRAINNFDLGNRQKISPVPTTKKPNTDADIELWCAFSGWVVRINRWLERIFPSQAASDEKWKYIPEAHTLFEDRLERSKERLNSEQFLALHRSLDHRSSDPKTFEENYQKLKDKFEDKRWESAVTKWPDLYIPERTTAPDPATP